MGECDAIVVQCGGLTKTGKPHRFVKERLDFAAKFHREEYLFVVGAGTVNKPPVLDSKGFVIFEADASARYLIKQGVNPKKIIKERASYDTVGTFHFLRNMLENTGLRKLLIITSEFHMPRTEMIANFVLRYEPISSFYSLCFQSTPNSGIDASDLEIRIEKEKKSFDRDQRILEKMRDWKMFSAWLLTRHEAYRSDSLVNPLSGDILASY